jgi:hypothetical protein
MAGILVCPFAGRKIGFSSYGQFHYNENNRKQRASKVETEWFFQDFVLKKRQKGRE